MVVGDWIYVMPEALLRAKGVEFRDGLPQGWSIDTIRCYGRFYKVESIGHNFFGTPIVKVRHDMDVRALREEVIVKVEIT